MDRNGANTFPFYKSTSRTEKHSHKEFCCAFVLSRLEKIKDGGDSCFRDISQTSVKQSVPYPPITADDLAHQPMEDHQSAEYEFPDEDVMFLKVKDCDEPLLRKVLTLNLVGV